VYSFISGRVAEAREGTVVIENNGIGYELLVSNNTLTKCSETGKSVQLYTYMKVSDDGVALYGFASAEEKSMFLKLTTVSGVGPKVALAVLSGLSLNDLGLAIVTNDTAALTRVKGVGKKTAERIILELKEKVDASAASIIKGGEVLTGDSETNDAIAALCALGLTRSESVRGVERALSLGAATAEQIIALALKSMNG